MRRLSIGVRLTLWYLAFFALAQFIFGIGMWLILQDNIYDIVDDTVEEQIDDLKTFLRSQPQGVSITKLQQELTQTYAHEHSGDYLAIYAGTGEVIYRSAFLQEYQPQFPQFGRGSEPVSRNYRFRGRPFRFTQETLEINGHRYQVEMGAPADDAVETLRMFRSYLLMFAPIILLAAGSGGYWLSRRALSPVDALVRTAREVSGTKLSTRLQKLETGDELQRLSDTLNEMLDRIESAFLRITEFTADASHELRTPVSLIRTEAELALRRSRGEAEYQESLRHILLEAERTTTLIEQLLSLARADSGRETLRFEPVGLRGTLWSVVAGWQQVATIRNLKFSTSLEVSDPFVMGDETLLRRLIDILLDNAFKYTSPPGSVYLSLERSGENAVITVRDTGVGIPTEEQGRIFERFYRVDKARSRAQGGSGLGLAIAQWIVTQHRGSIRVESGVGQGAAFLVELPGIAAPVKNPLLV